MSDIQLQLKPCPNCGLSTGEFLRVAEAAYGPSIECGFCQMRGPSRATEELAIESWNELPRKENALDDGRLLDVCPFCGSSDVSLQKATEEFPMNYVACNTCDADGPTITEDDASLDPSVRPMRAAAEAVRKWNDAPRRRQWTTEKPTKEGWYLARWDKGSELREVYRDALEGCLVYTTISNTCHWPIEDVDDAVEWAGPILMPKEAEK